MIMYINEDMIKKKYYVESLKESILFDTFILIN